MKTKLHYVFSLAVFLIGFSVFGQNNKDWKKSTSSGNLNLISINDLDKRHFQIFELNAEAFKQSLVGAPLRGTANSNTIISVPNELGNMEAFRILEAPVFDEELSAMYPEIKSYVGFSVETSGVRLRMSVSPLGVQTMISYLDRQTVFMQPVTGDASKYIVYNRAAKGDNDLGSFRCETIEDYSKQAAQTRQNSSLTSRDADDQTLRTYRIAMSVTGEYTQYFGGTVPGALAAINNSINRNNEVYETDLGIKFEVIANTTNVIYTNANTDPYSPASQAGNWNAELQSTLTSVIGDANYDIGHLFGATGGGGNAGCIGCVCSSGKGSAYTSPADGIPSGDNFDIDFVAHEIGHQMGANHTFSMSTEGTGVNAEPGSGTTIMGYAGITGASDVQQHSDPYFHYHSINQISNNIATAPNNCAATTAITNNPPNASAGPDYAIPQGTAYVLEGSATDADPGDTLMYCWEQTNSGQVTNTSFGPTLTGGSMNRSLPPTTSPDRYIPKWSRVVAGQLTETNPTVGSDWETVATVARSMTWALTVRDRVAAAGTAVNGQSSFDLTSIMVENVPAFTVNTPPTWGPNSTQTATWNVGSTDNGTINCQSVNILFSTDGGLTYPTTLASNTPNDGSQSITVPNISDTSTARLLVEAADNIFYAMSTNFSVSNAPDFGLSSINGDQSGGCGNDTVTYNMDYLAVNGFSETTTFSAAGNPAGTTVTFNPTSLNASGSFTMEITGLNAAADNNYTISVTGTSTSITKSTDVSLTVANSLCASVGNLIYQTRVTGVVFNSISTNDNGMKVVGYTDNTAISTDVNRESAYDLTININTDGNFQNLTKVWVDWNQNCSFDDVGEEYDLGYSANLVNQPTSGSPLSITIPSDAALGTTTMRVANKYVNTDDPGLPEPCLDNFDGETEDYSVNVLASLSVNENELSSFVIFPNPNSGEFTVKFNSTTTNDVKVEVFDIRGRLILNNKYSNNGAFNQAIDLNNAQSGMYLINVTDGDKKATRKIIIN